MQGVKVILCLLSLIVIASAINLKSSRLTQIIDGSPIEVLPTSDDKTCGDCASVMINVIDTYLTEILDGEIATCHDLCTKLNKTTIEHDTCLGICDIAGIKGLQKFLNATDPSPIYFCQIIKRCAEVSGGVVNITDLYVSPTSGPEGTDFQIFFNYDVLSATSAGIISMSILVPKSQSEGGDMITNGQPVGSYSLEMAFDTTKWGWTAGTYIALCGVCAGDCDTVHPYSGVYAVAESPFNITKS